jgi:hypothetical protein
MAQHEACCTLNPNRTCRMCKVAGFEPTRMDIVLPLARLLRPEHMGMDDSDTWEGMKIRWREWLKTMEEITHGCPACMLAILRQTGISADDPECVTGISGCYGPFWNYKAAKEAFWQAHPRQYPEECYHQ